MSIGHSEMVETLVTNKHTSGASDRLLLRPSGNVLSGQDGGRKMTIKSALRGTASASLGIQAAQKQDNVSTD